MERYWINQMEHQYESPEPNYRECAFCGWTLPLEGKCANPTCNFKERRKQDGSVNGDGE